MRSDECVKEFVPGDIVMFRDDGKTAVGIIGEMGSFPRITWIVAPSWRECSCLICVRHGLTKIGQEEKR